MGVKDIDFDELDRAVSSLLGSVDDDKGAEQSAKESATAEPTTSSPAAVSSKNTDTSLSPVQTFVAKEKSALPVVPSVAETTAIQTSPTHAEVSVRSDRPVAMKRKGGRFMDVVHPSSDMKSAPSLTPPSARAGRFTTVNPSRSMASNDPVKDDSAIDMAQLLADSQSQEEPMAQQETTPQPSSLMDPLEFHGFSFEDTVDDENIADESKEHIEASDVQEVPSKPLSISDDAAVIPPSGPISYSEPLSSPFLSDTKVNKRPLGAFSAQDDSSVETSSVSGSDALLDNASDQSLDAELVEMQRMAGEASEQMLATELEDTQTTADATVLPAELETELLSIESSESIPKPAPMAQEVPVVKLPEPQVSAQLQGGSITQQYKEQQPLGTQQQTTAIYDVDTFERPLQHLKKKSSGWLVVTGIVLLVLAGIAGGAYVYLYVL